MKCPYRLVTTEREIRPIDVPTQPIGANASGVTTSVVTLKKIISEDFAECLYDECPFYGVYADKGECNRATSEGA